MKLSPVILGLCAGAVVLYGVEAGQLAQVASNVGRRGATVNLGGLPPLHVAPPPPGTPGARHLVQLDQESEQILAGMHGTAIVAACVVALAVVLLTRGE